MHPHRVTVTLILALATLVASALAQTATTPRAGRVARDVAFLAADGLSGRKTGEPGNDSAARYLARRMRETGLAPAGDSGTFLQRWTAGSTTVTRDAGVAGRNTANVVGLLPGSGSLRNQAVLVGAHFDHLGTGPAGSLEPDSAGVVHNGADDNASGTAALLEVARLLAEERRGAAVRNARAVVFVLFSGEEQGLLGSSWYAEHPVIQMDSTIAMINFDMVGRMRGGRLLALGAGSAVEWPALLDSANAPLGLDLRASGDGWGPSDHASFFARKRPVLHLFTDLHENYHRTSDDAARIDADGIVRAADLAAALVRRLAARPAQLTFVDAPPPPPPAVAASGSRPVLGTIPDMTGEPGGVRLSGVRAGSPAEAAGLRAGDVLTGLGEHPIANLQDFQNALMAHRPGDRVEVRFRRDSQAMSVMVTLGGRAP
jgi:hypothetical protein